MRTNQCDPHRIDTFFEGISGADEDLAKHLETCESCRGYLDSKAAAPEEWTEAAKMLQQGDHDVAGSFEYSAGGTVDAEHHRSSSIQAVLSSLSPSDDPHRLGRIGGYEVSGIVGAGAMGVVLKAFDGSLDRVVAIKVMAPHLANNATARKRFSREAKAAAAVLHPNVISIHSVSSDESIPYLVMAYIRGGSLQKRLEREGSLSTIEILRIGSQLAAGLSAAHEQGLVHRDIKPENILLEEGVERVTLTDFGLARAVDDATVTREGAIAGTPQYMSPEQASGEAVDQRSDLFSLGSVLYALSTGRPPFRAHSSYGVMRRINDDSPTSVRELNPEIPQWLCSIIAKLMVKDKAGRFSSANEVHELLESCLRHVQQPTEIKLPEIPQVQQKNRSSFPLILIGVFAVVTLIAGVLLFFGVLPLPGGDEPQQKQEVAQKKAAVNIQKTLPATWEDLGLKHLAGYPKDEITLINFLNQSRGAWKFKGSVARGEARQDIQGELRIKGGCKEMLDLGSVPTWTFEVDYSGKDKQKPSGGVILALPNPQRLTLMMNRGDFGGQRPAQYIGKWDVATRTVSWSKRDFAKLRNKLPLEKSAEQEKSEVDDDTADREEGMLKLVFDADGSITVIDKTSVADGEVSQMKAHTTYRLKVDLAAYRPAKPDSTKLPNGYAVFVASRLEMYLQDETEDLIVGPNVAELGSKGDLVFGKVVGTGARKRDDDSGFFVLNSGEGDRDLMKGMTEELWIKELKKRGLKKAPELISSDRKRPRGDWSKN